MAFFMTLGSASSESVEAGAHQCPLGAGVSAATSARSIARRSAKCVNTCSTGAGDAISMPLGSGARRGAFTGFASTPSRALRSCPREARAAGGGGAGSRHRRAARRRRCRSAWAVASSRALTGSSACRPSRRAIQRLGPGAEAAGGFLRRADRRAEIHQRLGEFSCALGRDERLELCADERLGSRQRRCRSRKARAITRSTLPSTTATGSSKAIAAIAADV